MRPRPPSTSIPTATAAAVWAWKARTRWRNSSTAWRAISKIRKPRFRSGSGCKLWRIANPDAAERQEARNRADLRIGALGSGSDYTAFLDHLGIASLNLGFGGEDGGGIYHSIYDDFYWYTHFSDTDFVYGRALAQTAGTAVMRLADAELLPFDFDNFTDTMRRYVDEVERLARDKRDQIVERNREIDEGVFAAIDDPRHKMVPPAKEPVPPFLNFAPLENGMAALTARRRTLRPSAGARVRERRLGAGSRESARRQRAPGPGGARAHSQRWPAQPPLVPAPDLRARASTPATA